jgi:hypothetical protein
MLNQRGRPSIYTRKPPGIAGRSSARHGSGHPSSVATANRPFNHNLVNGSREKAGARGHEDGQCFPRTMKAVEDSGSRCGVAFSGNRRRCGGFGAAGEDGVEERSIHWHGGGWGIHQRELEGRRRRLASRREIQPWRSYIIRERSRIWSGWTGRSGRSCSVAP